jgi:hypothetical protein
VPVIQHRGSLVACGDRGSLTTKGDPPAAIDDQCAVGNRYQCGGSFGDRWATCDVIGQLEPGTHHLGSGPLFEPICTSSCGSFSYSSYANCYGGYMVNERLVSNETYPVRPDTVLPDEPGHLD